VYASHDRQTASTISASIAFNRPQATLFAGKADGKMAATPEKVSRFQMVIGAGDN
jgi:pyrrolidone-carboxylate peptidase